MPWTTITIPNQGGATWRKTIKAVIDNLSYLFGISESVADTALPNPSFDVDTDGNNVPDEWAWTPYNGGTQTLDATDSIHGGKSLKITQPSGAGNGGGTLETIDYFAVSAKRTLELQWTHYCSAAGMHDLVEVRWFDKDKIFISTTAVYDSTSNPTAWRIQSGNASPPSTARFAKLRITGGKNDTNIAGISRWDDFKFQEGSSRAPRTQRVFTSGTTWTAPDHITRAHARLWGGGGGGSASGGGGGGGEYVEGVITIVPGENYTVTIGAAGAAGGNGGDTSFVRVSSGATILSAMGGSGSGGAGGGAGGTGGAEQAASVQGQTNRIDGQRGRNNITGIIGGAGGDAPSGGGGGAGTAGTGTAGSEPGGGGGGGAAGGAGAKGRIILEY